MTADREMLEMAAKAAGIDLAKGEDGHILYDDLMGALTDNDAHWNPKDDDGDAFRLAVKLGVRVVYRDKVGMAFADVRDVPTIYESVIDHNNDPAAATRMAILRAAAQIGKEMP